MKKKAFTLIELLVVISIIALLLSILMPALTKVKLQAKGIVCRSNMKQLTLGWIMYADENEDRLVNACVLDKINRVANPDVPLPWVLGEVWYANLDDEEKQDAIEEGSLYPYSGDTDLYACPTGIRGEALTYAIVSSMNGDQGSLMSSPSNAPWFGAKDFKKRGNISRPSERMVFIDEGRATMASFGIWADQESWLDPPTIRHGKGTNIAFADGHSEYWKWKDERTIELAEQVETLPIEDLSLYSRPSADNEDLERMQKSAWGSRMKRDF